MFVRKEYCLQTVKTFFALGVFSVAALASPQTAHDWINTIPGRELGPTTMGGRVSELAVYEKEPRIFYIATASGGLWRTKNGGITTEPVMFNQGTGAMGAVALNQSNPDDVWVGTGEQNSRNSSSWGDGVYRSQDGGKTWANLGLKDTKHISRIVLDPKNKDVAYVAALGHLWGPSKERGMYKTADGGKTWTQQLFVDDLTGIIDLEMNPRNSNELICAAWTRRRWAYRWESGGEGSAIYKTKDGGKTWNKISKGLPEGPLGRIGLSVMASNPKIWVASVEHKEGGVFRSEDGGESWAKVNPINPRPFYFSLPYQDPVDEDRIYLPAVNFHYSSDKGKTFQVMRMNIHVDHHAIWVNPQDNKHIIIGNDGGVAQSRDRGEQWEHINNFVVSQFYAVAVDMRKPYWVYGGLQDNGSWGGPTQTKMGHVKYSDWFQTAGGDGFHVAVDPDDWRIVYSESQGGALQRLNIVTGERASIRPRPPQGERYRFNWSSPVILSPHNSATLYFGGNKLFKSVNRGANWKEVSPDLTTNDSKFMQPPGGVTPENTGAETHCTIITISESPRQQGQLWVGTDDGLLHVSENDGQTWTNVTANIPDLPRNTWCSRVIASNHSSTRAYATFDGHRNNDYKPYVYVTDDLGKTWAPLTTGLGENDSCYVVKEGLVNEDLLYVGTELGLYVSLDRGRSWTKYGNGTFGTVRVDDLVIHPRELDAVVATHGRGFWILPANSLEQLTAANRDKDVHLIKPVNAHYLGYQDSGWYGGDREFKSPNTAHSVRIEYWLKSATTEKVTVSIETLDGTNLGNMDGTGVAGLNSVVWRMRRVSGGRIYNVILKVGEKEHRTMLTIEDVSQTDPLEAFLEGSASPNLNNP